MKLKDAMLCWAEGGPDVIVVDYSNGEDCDARRYPNSRLACFAEWDELSNQQRLSAMLMSALNLIVRDKCDPLAVHRALLRVDEYVRCCPDDMPELPAAEIARRYPA